MGSIGRALVDNIVNGGFGGPIYPVHPTAEAVGGLPAYPSVADIPDDVDVAIVAVPATQVVKVAHDCGRKGVFGLVIISAGFAEAGESGAAVQRELVAVARNYGMRIIGPNCLGVVNTSPTVALHATFGSVEPPAGRIGLLSQSGAIGIVVLDAAVKTGLGVSTFVSAGNKADLSGNDLLQYWEDDDDTDVVMLYLESFGNPRKFARLARRVSRSKPIVVVKSGRTAAGRRAASSHTAALATPDDAVDALFRQAGVLRVDNVRTMFGVGRVLAHQPLPAGRRVAIIGNSGGPGILAADACATADLTIPDLSPDTQARLSAILPPSAAVANPVDLLAGAGPQQYDAVISAVLDDDVVDAAVVIFTPTSVTTAEAVGAAVAVAAGRSSKPVVAAFLTVEDGDIVVPSTRTVPRFSAAEDAVFALGRVADYADWRRRPVGEVPEFSDVEPARAEAVITGALAESPEGRWLDATEGREVLEAYRIRQVTTLVAEDLADALCIASEIGYPVALKAGGTEIVHKSEEGAVALDIGNAEALSAAWERMAQRLGARFTSGVMQPMVPRGTETLMGITSDPLFGPIVVFGLGGTVTELVGDRTIRLLPLTTDDAAEMLHSLRMSPLLFGYRGSEPVDAAALSSMLLRLSQLAEGNPEIVELDLNPVVAMHDGAVVLDAKVRVAPAIRTELPLRQLRSS
jgi:acetyl coenzyme A synthetase (ADP forming)-like protein